ncbi:type VI secretion system lipoprotein TssJ [Pantoea eucalypti]|jgi:type VI secretion system protein VasD|uniref:Type VI secretion system lipoprotein TssJ n=1 Tax=Pantoea eucalypti TaxID=470933 RepID=A0ABY2ZCC4_9GAMM|nr:MULTISPECIES: type VI secretion system lipoprotein TssJ [Pantoea]PQL28366.1 type VI secretion system lipoprotein TssJ [Pantoea ananatis]QXG53289.1 type VI secretion system lipoprotein TssJ [Pantoea jilinensis]AWP33224.1 type VI secretion system-associated lipoprotein [Pantoea vagans]EFM19814.1 type VI secretion lipoprotein, VC_A0113 family [Pantoea sp. aB]ELP24061.1 Type VI secretion lipoprotein, VasD [Pantoea agglomerans 299R]
MMRTTQLRGGLIVLLALLLAACSSSKQPVAYYNLDVQGQNQLNGGAPLKVRVLLLSSDAEFMSADFFSLQNQSATVLGSAQLNTQQFFLTPEQRSKTLRIKSLPETRFIGIMAEYQALDGKVWRLSLPVPEDASPSFWAFWKRNDGELNARIVAGINGLRVEKQ